MSDTDNFSTPRTIESLASAVTELADEVYLSLGTIGTALTGLWNDLTEKLRRAPRSTDLAPLGETIVGELERRGRLFDGAGVVMADGVLSDRRLYLDWWLSNPAHEPQRHTVELNPQSEYFYDYTAMDWYVIPRDQGRRWVHGPYLDFACTDQYVCTFAIPVRTAPGSFLGIAGADVPVGAIEEALLPRFRAAGPTVALVNNEGRVILGTDPRFPPGSKANRRDRPAAGVPIDTIPWSLQLLGSATPH
ncbi:cache domain-containing protein [Nocardia australiensis]|uniref:cache domain-containing protein n=1 Tax=Nocardia australiensis TaxID=2887191 RepID=UPI001D14204C|nr:cache domain-containing protein [Nocardia australiensis]